MGLRDLEGRLLQEYRTDSSDIISDFYVPCLERSQYYCRAVGFFASSSLAAAASGLRALIMAGGQMRLIASPMLSSEDIKAIEEGLSLREEAIEKALIGALQVDFDKVVKDRIECLSWLIGSGLLEIKIAVPTKAEMLGGIYHEKVGIFGDNEGDFIGFTGSPNESASGLINNFECIDVFISWDEKVSERASRKLKNFENLWNNSTRGIDVIEFPEAARRELLRHMPKQSPVESDTVHVLLTGGELSAPGVPRIPSSVKLRGYQEQAIQNWMRNKARGTLKMATGSGKTIISLAAAAHLYKKLGLQALLIICPYKHLVEQWGREARKFGLEAILACESPRRWEDALTSQLYGVRSGKREFVCCITTNATLMSEAMQSVLQFFPKRSMVIGDEVHNLGAPRLARSLPGNIQIRLGLSATPERYFDERGTEAVFEYFGRVLQPEFTLRDALRAGALVHYLYYPIVVDLTPDEAEEYEKLTRTIGKMCPTGELDTENSILTQLLVKRSRLIGSAANKLVELRELMLPRLHQTHTLFYCGDGTVNDNSPGDDTSDSTEGRRQVEAVTNLLNDLGFDSRKYTYETSLEEREVLRDEFDRGKIQGLVAIRCLDEGVDIPSVRTAVILASSVNPRQFIQRRGRILRPHASKTRAELFDMIVAPPSECMNSFEVERGLVRRELTRFLEFADLADNNGAARLAILELQRRFSLLDI